jgi:hypothetical protein
MNSSVAQLRPRRVAPLPTSGPASERLVRHRVGIVWGLLVLNALTYYGSALHIPHSVGKAITASALPAALIVALTVNRRLIIRPNVFLFLLSLLVVETIITSLQPQHIGTLYRTFRLGEYVFVLWLITPWWGRRDLLLVRYHLTALSVILGSVVLGLLVVPGHALAGKRLQGALWAIPPPQVAHYAAIMFGLVVLLWLSGHLRGRPTLVVVVVAGAMLLLTHTRTALSALIVGFLVAGLSLITVKVRARKFFAGAGAVVAITILTLSSLITAYLTRGQNTQQLHNLTGRTEVWGPLLALPRDQFQMIFGFGLSNDSSPVNGLPIDSNWLSAYQEEGLIGVLVCAIILVFLLVAAYFQTNRVRRALAIFLVTYCLVASFTETAFLDVSMYLLDLTVAASLIVSSAANPEQI